jgi:error-prone DNA polymerase
VPLHPLLEPVLARTLGVPLFQEQLLRIAMVAADFTGGEAEDLRRAMGFKRSKQRMQEIEVRLREGMTRKGIVAETQDRIVQAIVSFALYGFPESHAASFALIAYASGYMKTHYLAAFTCAILNNQPMGFYSPSVLIKDAQRHGLRVLPVDVTRSEWNCTIESSNQGKSANQGSARAVRLGLRYARGLRDQTGAAIVQARGEAAFESVDDLALRVPELHTDEMNRLAEIGALNPLDPAHRRDALWKAGRASRPVGKLLERVPETVLGDATESPLMPMSTDERITADYRGTGVTIGKHPMAYRREEMNELGVTAARDLVRVPRGGMVRIAGNVIVRQRPGTAAGICFLTVEDETGIANAVVMPDIFAANRLLLVSQPWLLIEGKLQNVDTVIHVQVRKVAPLGYRTDAAPSHDFH